MCAPHHLSASRASQLSPTPRDVRASRSERPPPRRPPSPTLGAVLIQSTRASWASSWLLPLDVDCGEPVPIAALERGVSTVDDLLQLVDVDLLRLKVLPGVLHAFLEAGAHGERGDREERKEGES